MSEAAKIRKSVSASYSKALRRPPTKSSGCCAGTGTGTGTGGGAVAGVEGKSAAVAPKGIAAAMAGYDPTALDALPEDAVQNSFGCGNPVALGAIREGDTVLDLGSGAGIDLLLAARRVGPTGRVIGVDMTSDMIERAKKNVADAGATNVEVRAGLIEELPVENASVDLVISNCVINLSPEKPRVFAEIARVLKPGGRFSIADIVVDEMPAWVMELAPLRSACITGAVSESEYLAGLRAAGLVDVKVADCLVYDREPLANLIGSEVAQIVAEEGTGCCGGDALLLPPETRDSILAALEGRVASVRFVGKKPAAR